MSSFLIFWRHLPEKLDPVVFKVGSMPVYWYALFFLSGAWVVYELGKKEFKKLNTFTRKKYTDFSFGIFLSALFGGKIGFLFFYWFPFVSSNELSFFPTLSSSNLALPGMSFFGGALGVTSYLLWFSRKNNISFFRLTDTLAPLLPVAFSFGRLGNFFHGELKGRVTEVTWGMYTHGETLLRHPSTLYAAFLEGIVLFSILFFLRKQNLFRDRAGLMTAFFCIGYGTLRFLGEFFREPDAQIGYFGIFTLNQIFSLIFCGIGVVIFTVQIQKKEVQ